MKILRLFFGLLLFGIYSLSSCTNQTSKKAENVTERQKQSLWPDSLKTNFTVSNSKTDFDSFVLTELIAQNEYDKNTLEIKDFIQTQEYENYRNSMTKYYVVNIDNLARKSKSEIEKVIGPPDYKEKVNPSKTPCPCDKYKYLNDLVEIVFMNGKADWITVNNRSSFVKIYNLTSYQSVNKFDDYTYVKVTTK